MSDLVVRMYNVRHGDAFLVMIPDEEAGQPVTRNILFDFGNVRSDDGGSDVVFEPVIDDIRATTGGTVDLYVLSHEHLDHVQAMLFADGLGKPIQARRAWLTGSADPTYYDTHNNAKKQKIAALTALAAARLGLMAAGGRSELADVLLGLNNPQVTGDCVDYLRTKLTPTPGDVHYVDRTSDLGALWPTCPATITIWAPEEDTATYYGQFKKLAANLQISDGASVADAEALAAEASTGEPAPPAGVDAGAFYNLLDIRHVNQASTLLQIDAAANNTSVVMLIEWKGWRLLFTGDAEIRSWKEMNKRNLLKPVHFLKVSHHGSSNGTPDKDLLDKILPVPVPDGRERRSVVSTFPGTYPGVPDTDTLTELQARTTLISTADFAAGQVFVDLTFPG
jgi:beta-lactamase superfamily II metal-dependent hydrolase